MNGKIAKARGFFDKFFLRALMEFVALAAVLSLLGTYVYDRMDILLIDSLRESVAQQSQSTAYVLVERFQHKLDELESRAELIQRGIFLPKMPWPLPPSAPGTAGNAAS